MKIKKKYEKYLFIMLVRQMEAACFSGTRIRERL